MAPVLIIGGLFLTLFFTVVPFLAILRIFAIHAELVKIRQLLERR